MWGKLNFLILLAPYQLIFSRDAFCLKQNNIKVTETRFPLEPPQRHLPWVWDAVLSMDGTYVEVTTISRNACKFSRSQWKKIAKMFPEYADQLGGGLDSSILVPVDNSYNYARNDRGVSPGLMGKTVICVFYKDNIIISRISSRRIDDEDSADMSTIQIRCPVPYERSDWTHMRLERTFGWREGEAIDRSRQNHTVLFAVCHPIPTINTTTTSDRNDRVISLVGHSKKKNKNRNNNNRKEIRKNNDKENKYQYEFSICTATARYSRPELVEWLEYHKLQGVQHFFIYNTALGDQQTHLFHTLSDYIRNGSVTIVSWPYQNCVDGMGAGRWVHYVDEAGASSFFQPPRSIAQTAALASCYSRFRSTSRWLGHVDDDEFFAVNYGRNFYGSRVRSVLELIQRVSDHQPQLRGFYFKPLNMADCPQTDTDKEEGNEGSLSRGTSSTGARRRQGRGRGRGSDVLPRLGHWQTARMGPDWEGKLIMRTEAVGMFWVHYITLREPGNWAREPHIFNEQEAVVLHYKPSSDMSGVIFGGYLPLQVGALPRDCRHLDSELNRNGTNIRRKVTSLIIPFVEKNYLAHLNQNINNLESL